MKSQNWNKIVALKLFFVCFFEMDFWSMSLFFGTCRFENVSWAVVALKIFLAPFSLKFFFGAYRCKSDFLFLLLWKWFFAIVDVKIIFGSSRSKKCLSLTSLKMIFLFLSLWILFWALVALKTFWHFFENVFLAVIALKILFWHFLFWK